MRRPTTPRGMLRPSVRPRFVEFELGGEVLLSEVELGLMLSWLVDVDEAVGWRVEVENVEEVFDIEESEVEVELEVQPLWQLWDAKQLGIGQSWSLRRDVIT